MIYVIIISFTFVLLTEFYFILSFHYFSMFSTQLFFCYLFCLTRSATGCATTTGVKQP